MATKHVKWCGDCNREDDMISWCDVCRTFVCIDCDALHDCVGDMDLEESDDAPQVEDIDDDFNQLFGIEEKESDDEDS